MEKEKDSQLVYVGVQEMVETPKVETLTEITEYIKECFERFKDDKSNNIGEIFWHFDKNTLADINSLYNNLKKRDLEIQERLKELKK